MPKKLASPPTVNPPEGWKDGEGFGFLYGRDAQGQPVDLVRISDLVRWLQTVRKLTRKDAVLAVANALPHDALGWLYQLKPGDGAGLVPAASHFGQLTPERLESEKRTAMAAFNRGDRMLIVGASWSTPYDRLKKLESTVPVDPGVSALRQYLVNFSGVVPVVRQKGGDPVDTLDRRANFIAHLAIPRDKAHALFCWGTVVDESKAVESAGPAFDFSQAFIALCEARKTRKGDAWTNDEKATLQAELARFPNRTRGLREAMAQALGLRSAEAVSQILREYKQAQDDARKAAANVVQVRDGKKVG